METCIYTWFSLSAVVIFYNVIVNNELANTKPLFLWEIQGSIPVNL